MDKRINDPCPPTADPLHSMMLVAKSHAMVSEALRLVCEAEKLMAQEWQYHRPDCHWKLPDEYAANAAKARESIRPFLADIYWTENSLRRYGKICEAQQPGGK